MRRGAGLAAVALAAAVALTGCQSAAEPTTSEASDAPTEVLDHGIPVGDGATRIDLYVDYLCPYCGYFEAANGEYLGSLVDSGEATVVVHPLNFLEAYSNGTRYSTRAANAFLCVTELAPEAAWSYHQALFADQPAEGTDGLDDEALVALGAGVDGLAECVAQERYSRWATEATNATLDAGTISGTPTVFVDGEQYTESIDDPEEFEAFVAAHLS